MTYWIHCILSKLCVPNHMVISHEIQFLIICHLTTKNWKPASLWRGLWAAVIVPHSSVSLVSFNITIWAITLTPGRRWSPMAMNHTRVPSGCIYLSQSWKSLAVRGRVRQGEVCRLTWGSVQREDDDLKILRVYKPWWKPPCFSKSMFLPCYGQLIWGVLVAPYGRLVPGGC